MFKWAFLNICTFPKCKFSPYIHILLSRSPMLLCRVPFSISISNNIFAIKLSYNDYQLKLRIWVFFPILIYSSILSTVLSLNLTIGIYCTMEYMINLIIHIVESCYQKYLLFIFYFLNKACFQVKRIKQFCYYSKYGMAKTYDHNCSDDWAYF